MDEQTGMLISLLSKRGIRRAEMNSAAYVLRFAEGTAERFGAISLHNFYGL